MINFKTSVRLLAAAHFVLCFSSMFCIVDVVSSKPESGDVASDMKDNVSFSDAVLVLKKKEKLARSPGFRNKGRRSGVLGKKKIDQEVVALVEREVEKISDKEVKRKKTELDQIKYENKKLEAEILNIMGEGGAEDKVSCHGLPDITPTFPAYARLFPEFGGYSHLGLDFQTAGWMYDDRGKVVELVKMIVGYHPVTVQDVLLISRLARNSSYLDGNKWRRYFDGRGANSNDVDQNEGNIDATRNYLLLSTSFDDILFDLEMTSSEGVLIDKIKEKIKSSENMLINNHYLNRIADKKLEFKADLKRLNLHLNVFHTVNENFAVGIQVPVIFGSNKFEMISEFTQAELEELRDESVVQASLNGTFFSKYPAGLRDFYDALLREKGFDDRSFRKRHNIISVGDISGFVNRKIASPELCTSGVVGLGITAPSGSRTDTGRIWPVIPGNGGFWEVRGHMSLFWRETGFFNPHLFAEFIFRIGGVVQRRISRIVDRSQTKTRDKEGMKARDLPLGDGFIYNPEARSFKEVESKIPALAQGPVRKVNVNRGAQGRIRVGNLFKGFGSDFAYLDVFYEVLVEQEDSVSFRQEDPGLDVETAMRNTGKLVHTIGASWVYRMYDHWNLELNVNHVFFGKNTPRIFQVGLAVQYVFS